MKENVILLQEINDLKKEYHELCLKLKSAMNAVFAHKSRSNYTIDANESEEVYQMRLENQKLSEEIAMLEQRDAEINE